MNKFISIKLFSLFTVIFSQTEKYLDNAKLPDLLTLKYKAISDAKRELGAISDIRHTFIGFQEHLYESPKR